MLGARRVKTMPIIIHLLLVQNAESKFASIYVILDIALW